MSEKHNRIKEELEAVRVKDPDGLLKPADIVRYASDPQTALHQCFTWDDAAAAHRFRIEQARRVIQMVYVSVTPRANALVETRAYVSLSSDRANKSGGGGGYRPFVEVMTDDAKMTQYIRDVLAEVGAVLRKHEVLKDVLAPIFKGLSEVEAQGLATTVVRPLAVYRGPVNVVTERKAPAQSAA